MSPELFQGFSDLKTNKKWYLVDIQVFLKYKMLANSRHLENTEVGESLFIFIIPTWVEIHIRERGRAKVWNCRFTTSESHWTPDIFQFSQHKTKKTLWHLDIIMKWNYWLLNIQYCGWMFLEKIKIMPFDDVKMFTSSFVSMCWKCKFGKMTTQKNLRSDYKCQFSILTDNDGSARRRCCWLEILKRENI